MVFKIKDGSCNSTVKRKAANLFKYLLIAAMPHGVLLQNTEKRH